MDYVIYRTIVGDIGEQVHLIKHRINNPETFAIKLMQSIFPKYNKDRHHQNKQKEQSFQNLVNSEYAMPLFQNPSKRQTLKDFAIQEREREILASRC